MPINIPSALPARAALENERIFVMSEDRALEQDIRPLQIAIVNLMPTKIATEIQLLRLLSRSPLQVDITLIKAENHVSKNTSEEHLDRFYTTFSKVRNRKFDGMIITGAPVEQLPFEGVDYWTELQDIMDYSKENVFSTIHICWGAQAALYHHFGIDKINLPEKLFGVFPHKVMLENSTMFRGFDDVFYAPHSRHTSISGDDIRKCSELEILAESPEAGVCVALAPRHRQLYVTGHFEYDRETLAQEYFRDKDRGLNIDVPRNYFENDDPQGNIMVRWRSYASLFFSNWLNFYLYQDTPFDISKIGSF